MVDDGSEDTILRPRAAARRTWDFADADTIVPAGPSARCRVAPTPAPERSDTAPAAGAAAFYRISVGGGEPILLDVPAYLGRNPRAPRITLGAAPRLVQVPSDRREVSSTHVEIRQHGSSVVVTDLRSTNGTVLLIPGAKPLRLRQGESAVVIPGTVVDIGDGNRVEILSSQRLTQ